MFCKVFRPCLGLCPKEAFFHCPWKLRQQCLPEAAGSRTCIDKSRRSPVGGSVSIRKDHRPNKLQLVINDRFIKPEWTMMKTSNDEVNGDAQKTFVRRRSCCGR